MVLKASFDKENSRPLLRAFALYEPYKSLSPPCPCDLRHLSRCRQPQDFVPPFVLVKLLLVTIFSFPHSQMHTQVALTTLPVCLLLDLEITVNLPNFCPIKSRAFGTISVPPRLPSRVPSPCKPGRRPRRHPVSKLHQRYHFPEPGVRDHVSLGSSGGPGAS